MKRFGLTMWTGLVVVCATAAAGATERRDGGEIGPVATAAAGFDPATEGYELVWSDEFDGETLDPSRWAHRRLGSRRDGVNVEDTVALDGRGHLVISAYSEPVATDAEGQPTGFEHRTGMIATEGLHAWTDGYFEARVRFDSTAGHWFAFWSQSPTVSAEGLSPAEAGVEFDVVEHRAVDGRGKARTDLVRHAAHWGGYEPPRHQKAESHHTHPPARDRFVIYGLKRTPEGNRFYVDGRLTWAPDPEELPVSRVPQFLVLSGEVEDRGWAGGVPARGYGTREETTTRMTVDYVRVYRQRPAGQPAADTEGRLR